MNYQNIKFVFLILVFLFPPDLLIAGPGTKALKPKNAAGNIKLLISEKKISYYPVSFFEPAIITVKGPGKLKIINRAHFGSLNGKKISNTLLYRINGAEKIKVVFNNLRPDAKAEFEDASLGFPSIGENIFIELTRGEHTIELWSGEKNTKICSRFLFTEKKEKKIDWVSLSPVYPNEPINLVTNEDVFSYYRYSAAKPLIVRVTGPTILRILNRIEFDYRMKGSICYRIQVKEDKKVKNTYMLNGVRSDVTSYKKDGKKIPGKANEIIIHVPNGNHSYEIITLDKCTVLGRVLFPKKDIKLEGKTIDPSK